ncbi:MAG: RNA 2',3'-cyclic phosphodiesterase [Candidatus Nanohalarchaeota archaeon]|nr:MAG: RNA 2',3'-cyclic phosphodiesterase [Candidatus Nanohaloarchaeota archaeon]
MRCFIAIDIPKDIKKDLHSIQKPFEKYENMTLVNTKHLHCTLIFLGEIDKTQIEKTKIILQECSESHTAIKCQLKSTGVFPNPDYLKVIWTGISPKDQLAAIQKSLEIKLVETGLYNSLPHQQFTPHITIGRVRDSGHKHEILKEIEKNSTFTTPVFEINELKLKQSTLLPGGPIYDDIAVYKLREPA